MTMRARRIVNALTVIAAIVWVLPIVWMVLTSVKYEADIFHMPPIWILSRITFEHYVTVFERSRIFAWFVNSVVITAATTLIVLVVDTLAGYAFARLRFIGRAALFSVVIASLAVPFQVTLVPLYVFLSSLGMVNSMEAVILPSASGAFGVFLLRQFFLGIPVELEEAALIDGAGRLGILWRIIVPLAKPALSALGIFTALSSWNNFLWPLIVLQDVSKMTLPIGLATLQGTYSTSSYGVLMAAAVVSSLPILIIFVLLKNQVIRGITLTSGIK